MKLLKTTIVFVLVFLAVTELFLSFDIGGSLYFIPVAFVIAATITLRRKAIVHRYRMAFVKDYKHFMKNKRPR